jgi:peptide/nickel transport system substrate-binding protein
VKLALSLTLLLAAGFPAVADEPPQRGGTLIYAVSGEPDTYDCHSTTTQASLHVFAPHYSMLLRIDPANYPNVSYDLATAYEISPDGLAYTFHLRDNVKFHDGTKLTSEDVRVSYERLRNPPPGVISARKVLFEDIAAIEAPDPTTVVFRLSRENPSMLTYFALPWNCIFSAARLAQDPTFPAKNVMGSGPFRFVSHVAGSHWEGKRFEDYYEEGKPYLDGFRAQFITGAPMINAMQGGAIMAEFRGVSPGERTRLKEALGDKIVVEEGPWVCNTELFFNVAKKPFDDARVRRALSLAIDRRRGAEDLSKIAIVRYVGGVLRPGYKLASSDAEVAELPGFGRDIKAAREEAKRLLKDAGAEGLSFRLLNRATPMPYTPVALYLIDQWRQIGVTAEHAPAEVKVQKASFNANTFEVGLDGVCEDIDDPNIQLLQFISTDRSARSRGGFVDRELDTLYDRQKQAKDEATRRDLIRQFERRTVDQANTVTILWWNRLVAHSSRLRGWHMTASTFVGQDFANVWLAKE